MSRFQENFLEIRKELKCKKGRGKFLVSFIMRFSSIENIKDIVVGYRYYRIRQGIDTIELVSISDGKYRYNEISISIDTLMTVIDKYRYLPLHENCEKILGNFEKMLEENRKNLK